MSEPWFADSEAAPAPRAFANERPVEATECFLSFSCVSFEGDEGESIECMDVESAEEDEEEAEWCDLKVAVGVWVEDKEDDEGG